MPISSHQSVMCIIYRMCSILKINSEISVLLLAVHRWCPQQHVVMYIGCVAQTLTILYKLIICKNFTHTFVLLHESTSSNTYLLFWRRKYNSCICTHNYGVILKIFTTKITISFTLYAIILIFITWKNGALTKSASFVHDSY